MKTSTPRFALLALSLMVALTACGDATSPPVSARPPALPALDQNGAPRMIDTSGSNHVIALATWCGYSAEFLDIIKHARIRPYLGDDTFTFVLGDEWSTLESAIDERIASGSMTEADKQAFHAQVTSQGRPVILADEDFLADIPGEPLFVEDFAGLSGFPARYAAGPGSFEDHAFDALSDAGVPDAVLVAVVEDLRR